VDLPSRFAPDDLLHRFTVHSVSQFDLGFVEILYNPETDPSIQALALRPNQSSGSVPFAALAQISYANLQGPLCQ
jgi:hypothetical protein